jgi:hypothetical protein
MKPTFRFVLWSTAALLFLAILAVLWWKLYGQTPNQIQLPLNATCDLHSEACSSSIGVVTLELSIEPRPIPMLEPLSIAIRIKGIAAESVWLDFAGVEMFMGYNRVELREDNGIFQGTGVLPVCTADTMTWEATVLVQTANSVYRAPFRFVVSRPNV